jgi:uncharacterized membrane protein (UPF0127 family)
MLKTPKIQIITIIITIFTIIFGMGLFFFLNYNRVFQFEKRSSHSSIQIVSNSSQAISISSLNSTSGFRFQFDQIESAKSREEQEKGLMFRETLCDKCGMFFEFDNESYRTFWMKNTFVDLDIIFIDSSGQIVNIAEAKAEKVTLKDTEYPIYRSEKPAKYVLETPMGFGKKYLEGVNQLDLEFLKSQLIPMKE